MSSPLNIALLGAGRIGQVHARTIAYRVPSARLVAVADVNTPAAEACAAQFRIPTISADPLAAINDPSVDAVFICTTTDTHASLIEASAQAGKHIFCEKPVAMTLPEIDRALAAVDKAGIQLQIGFNRRFDANFARARHAVVSGEIGKPAMLHIISRDPAPPPIAYVKVSGGLFVDMAIHDFDMARFLSGSEVDEVYAHAGVTVDPAIGEAGDIDTAVTLLRFKNGVIGTIDNCRRASYGYDQRVEVFGSAGAIQTGNVHPNVATISDAGAVRQDLPLNFFMQRYTEAYAGEIEQFVAAINDKRPVPVNGNDGRAAFVIALAAQRSVVERRPVRIAEI
jgi:myo-inositol 2-dehydrogenase/D-chiro-inositol 1-dehydrogenase